MEDLTAFQRDALYVIAGLEEPKGLESLSSSSRTDRIRREQDTSLRGMAGYELTHDQRVNHYLESVRTDHPHTPLLTYAENRDELTDESGLSAIEFRDRSLINLIDSGLLLIRV